MSGSVSSIAVAYPTPRKKHRQISEGYCGPALLSVLLENCGIYLSQEEIVRIAGIESVISELGMTAPEIKEFFVQLGCQTGSEINCTLKTDTTLSELHFYLEKPNTYVIVNWQGVFVQADVLTPGILEEDNGHYCYAMGIFGDLLKILDSSFDYPRFIPLDVFLMRWWEDDSSGKYNRLAIVISVS